MGDENPERDELSAQDVPQDELEAQVADVLPAREVLSTLDASIAAPLDATLAANVLADDAPAIENAEQEPEIDPDS